MNTKQVGIEQLNFFVPPIYIDLIDLAKSRNIDPNKYTIGLGLEKMSLCPVSQDIITMGANAAFPIVSKEDTKLIDMVILATESGIDHSKSGAVAIHQLLNINPYARCIEMKHACFSATAGLLMARDYVSLHPDRKVLVIGSDVSKYGFNNSGEETQGAGAVAMLISSNPNILVLNNNSVAYTEDVYDFWRPVYSEVALVDGKLSNEIYSKVFHKTIEEYGLSTLIRTIKLRSTL